MGAKELSKQETSGVYRDFVKGGKNITGKGEGFGGGILSV